MPSETKSERCFTDPARASQYPRMRETPGLGGFKQHAFRRVMSFERWIFSRL
jgi:hypothetical protein